MSEFLDFWFPLRKKIKKHNHAHVLTHTNRLKKTFIRQMPPIAIPFKFPIKCDAQSAVLTNTSMWECDFCDGPKLKHTFLGKVRQTGNYQRLSERRVKTARMAERVLTYKNKMRWQYQRHSLMMYVLSVLKFRMFLMQKCL